MLILDLCSPPGGSRRTITLLRGELGVSTCAHMRLAGVYCEYKRSAEYKTVGVGLEMTDGRRIKQDVRPLGNTYEGLRQHAVY